MLTEAGEAVLPYCQQLLEVASEAYKTMQDFRVASTGVVSLGASQTVGTYLMPRLIATFKKSNPQVLPLLEKGYYAVPQQLPCGKDMAKI